MRADQTLFAISDGSLTGDKTNPADRRGGMHGP